MDRNYDRLAKEFNHEQGASSDSRSMNRQGGNSGGAIQTPTVQLDVPRFDGNESSGWVYHAEQFFAYHRTPANQRMVIESFHHEGKALQWYCWMEKYGAVKGWTDVVEALEVRIGPSEYDDRS